VIYQTYNIDSSKVEKENQNISIDIQWFAKRLGTICPHKHSMFSRLSHDFFWWLL
jgi:hypothetical protein